jgi:hypothetical protein
MKRALRDNCENRVHGGPTSDEGQDEDGIKGHAALGTYVREKAPVPPARFSLRATEI